MTSRKRQKAETRKKIFLAARTLFEKNGYHNTKIEDIVSSCQVAKGTFYTHFKTKSDILAEEFNLLDEDYMYFFENKLTSSPRDDIFNFLIYVLEEVENKIGKERTKIIYSHYLEDNNTSYLVSSERALYKIIEELLKKAFEKKDITPSELKTISGLIVSLIRGSIYDWCVDKNSNNLVELGKPKFKILLEGIL